MPHFVYFTLVPDDPPQNIRVIGIEPTVLKAFWLPVSNETINGIGLGYKLSLFTTAGTKIRNYTLNASVLSLEITGLDIWTNYSIRIAAFTIKGDGPWSDLILEDTDEEGQSTFTSTSLTSIHIFFQLVGNFFLLNSMTEEIAPLSFDTVQFPLQIKRTHKTDIGGRQAF